MIHVVAVLTTKPGIRANVPNVHAEKGCIEYGAAVDEGNAPPWAAKHGPDAIVVIEKWDSVDALKAHAAAPHMKAYAEKVKDMLAGRAIDVHLPAGVEHGVARGVDGDGALIAEVDGATRRFFSGDVSVRAVP